MTIPAASSATSPEKIQVAERRKQAMQLRLAGAQLQQIADQLGYRSCGAVSQDITRALRAMQAQPAAELLDLELSRLDRMLVGIWGKAANGDVKAIDRVLRIMERRAKYLGLDHADGLAARMTAMYEQLGGQVAAVIEAVLDDPELGLTEEQKARRNEVVVKHLRVIDGELASPEDAPKGIAS